MESIPIILESGRFYCCGGWSVNNFPSVHFTALKREFESMNTILNPGGWASFLSSHSKYSLLYDDDQETLWYHTTENLLGNEAAPVALLDARLLTKDDYNKTAEFFFETINVPQLTIVSEATASFNALFAMDFSYVNPSTAKNGQNYHVTQKTLPFSSSFSGVIVTADFETLRLQPFFNGLPASNFKTHHPFGERVPKALLYSKIHGTLDSHNCTPQSSNKIQKTLSDVQRIPSKDQVYEECRTSIHHPNIIQNVPYDHLCCWRTVQFLYDQYCYVSFDPDMDSWLVQRHLEKKEDNETHSTLKQCACLKKIVEHIPTWTVCSESLNHITNNERTTTTSAPLSTMSNLEKKHVCELCSQFNRNHTGTPLEHKKNSIAGNKGFVNTLGYAFVPMERELWKTTFNRTCLTLEQLIQRTLRNSIFLAPEILFRPSALISSLYTSSTLNKTAPSFTCASSLMSVSNWERNSSSWVPQNLAEEILSIIDKSPIDLRREMYRSTVILGKMTTLPFLTNRLVLEIQTGIYNRLKKSTVSNRSAAESVSKESIHVWNPSKWSNQIYASWIGTKHALQVSSNNSTVVQTLSREKLSSI